MGLERILFFAPLMMKIIRSLNGQRNGKLRLGDASGERTMFILPILLGKATWEQNAGMFGGPENMVYAYKVKTFEDVCNFSSYTSLDNRVTSL